MGFKPHGRTGNAGAGSATVTSDIAASEPEVHAMWAMFAQRLDSIEYQAIEAYSITSAKIEATA
jgi:hypothetical protein